MPRRTVPPAATAEADVDIDPDLVGSVASWFVRNGSVAPGLVVGDDGRARSWWWPHGDPWLDVDPFAALTRLGPLDVEVRSRPVTDLLAPPYEALVRGG